MNAFGAKSSFELRSAHPDLQRVAYQVLKIKDHSILQGHRAMAAQNAAYFSNPQRSKLRWPDGKHNGVPSMAIDVQTYPRPRGDDEYLREEQYYLLGLYVGIGSQMGITLRTGADWDRDGEISNNGWDDLFHVEIVED